MKKYIGICSLVLLAMFAAGLVKTSECFASRQECRQELTDNSKLDEANKLYKKAVRWIEDGDGVHEPQRAAKFYANAEEYLRRTVFALKELGKKYDIDVTKDVEYCEKLEREIHSSQGDAKRYSK
ncbi:MAG: hypothetical protein WC522_09290 [Candidatus Omnitrophota bacterium]